MFISTLHVIFRSIKWEVENILKISKKHNKIHLFDKGVYDSIGNPFLSMLK